MTHLVASLAGMAIAFGLLMLYIEGDRKKDDSIRWMAIAGFIGFFLLVAILGGGCSD